MDEFKTIILNTFKQQVFIVLNLKIYWFILQKYLVKHYN